MSGETGSYCVEVDAACWRELVNRTTVGGKGGGGVPPPVDVGAQCREFTVAAVVECVGAVEVYRRCGGKAHPTVHTIVDARLFLLDGAQHTNDHCRSEPEGVFVYPSGIVNTCCVVGLPSLWW